MERDVVFTKIDNNRCVHVVDLQYEQDFAFCSLKSPIGEKTSGKTIDQEIIWCVLIDIEARMKS